MRQDIEEVMRKQLATTKTIFDWMKSWDDEIRARVEEIKKQATNVMYIDMTNMEKFKESVENFKLQHPNANIQATGFVFSTKEPEKNTEFTYPQAKAEDIKEDKMTSKPKSKAKVAKKSTKSKSRK